MRTWLPFLRSAPGGCALPLVAVGSMDGTLTLIHGPTGAVLARRQVHQKYVVRVAWAHSGTQRGRGGAAEGPGEWVGRGYVACGVGAQRHAAGAGRGGCGGGGGGRSR